MMARKTIRPEDVVALVDTREQLPLDLSPLQVESTTLQSGDYSVRGLEDKIRIERKSLSDLLGCVGRDRERFEREIERLAAFPIAVLLIESSWPEIEMGQWNSKIAPSQVIGSLLSWQTRGIAIHMTHDHERAGRHAARLLFTTVRHEWERLQTLTSSIQVESNTGGE